MTVPRNGDVLRRSIIFKNVFIGIGGLAMVLVAIVAFMQSLIIADLRDDLNQSRHASECRFDLNAESDAISGAIDVTVAQIVVSAIANDDVQVQHLGDLLATQITDLADANERRLKGVEECNGRS